jgi:hypothetical protein
LTFYALNIFLLYVKNIFKKNNFLDMVVYINRIPKFLRDSENPKTDFLSWYSKEKLSEILGDIKFNGDWRNLKIDTNYIWIDDQIAILYRKSGCSRIRTDGKICDKPIYLGECCKNCCILFEIYD